jgi:hypothetical protein
MTPGLAVTTVAALLDSTVESGLREDSTTMLTVMSALDSGTEAEVAHQVSIQVPAALALVQDQDQDSAVGSGPAVVQQALAAATTSTVCPVSDLVASILE